MNNAIFISIAFITGSLIPLQLVFNAQLGAITRSPYSAGLIVLIAGLLTMSLIVVVMRPPMPSIAALAAAPPNVYLGGVIASVYIVAIIMVSSKLGVGLTTALILFGQLVMALILDHLGAFGNPQISINAWRVGGVLMMLGGIVAIKTH
jgi:transporter family-2 protein